MLEYLRIGKSGHLPDLNRLKPFKTVVVIETTVSQKRQNEISKWLVRSGCLYVLAWGHGCTSWDDSVDDANMERFDFGEIPSEEFVMTTWHESETLKEAMEFSKYCAIAYDRNIQLENVLILHLSESDKGEEFKKLYAG